MSLVARPLIEADLEPLRAILNAIIAAGGTTAYEDPFSPEAFRAYALDGPAVAITHTVRQGDRPIGFQTLARDPRLPGDWLSIASFTRRTPPVPGAGRTLFAATAAWARARGVAAIDATIRADNAGGLAFYRSLGFTDYHRHPAVPLKDGTPVDRIATLWRP